MPHRVRVSQLYATQHTAKGENTQVVDWHRLQRRKSVRSHHGILLGEQLLNPVDTAGSNGKNHHEMSAFIVRALSQSLPSTARSIGGRQVMIRRLVASIVCGMLASRFYLLFAVHETKHIHHTLAQARTPVARRTTQHPRAHRCVSRHQPMFASEKRTAKEPHIRNRPTRLLTLAVTIVNARAVVTTAQYRLGTLAATATISGSQQTFDSVRHRPDPCIKRQE